MSKNGTKSADPILKQLFRRSWFVGAAYNNVRGQGHGALYTLWPLIDKLYPDPAQKAKKIEALKRHTVFYNITPQVNTVGLGLFAAMEEKCAKDECFDASSINAMKAAIMGPMSGIGDAMFQVTIRIIATSIGLSFAMNGSWVGGALFFLIFNAFSYVIRRYLLYKSYGMGEQLVSTASESGLLQILTKAAAIIGLFMVGAMAASSVKLEFALSWMTAGAEVTLQSFFDAIMPKVLPLGLTLAAMAAIRKKMNANLLMLIMIVVAILGAWVGLF